MSLAKEIEETEARLAQLKRRAAAATCHEIGRHEWRLIGGKNAGCGNGCGCSVPVYECVRCQYCDYGDNDEAREAVAWCQAGQA